MTSQKTSVYLTSKIGLCENDTLATRVRKLKDRIKLRDPCLFDGSVSTLLYDRGVFINRSFDEVNLTQPSLVEGRFLRGASLRPRRELL